MSGRRARAAVRSKIWVADELESDARAWVRNVRATARCLRSMSTKLRRLIDRSMEDRLSPEPVLFWSTGKGSYDETYGALEEWTAMAWDDLWQVSLRGVGCVRRGTVLTRSREQSRRAAESCSDRWG